MIEKLSVSSDIRSVCRWRRRGCAARRIRLCPVGPTVYLGAVVMTSVQGSPRSLPGLYSYSHFRLISGRLCWRDVPSVSINPGQFLSRSPPYTHHLTVARRTTSLRLPLSYCAFREPYVRQECFTHLSDKLPRRNVHVCRKKKTQTTTSCF